jgi:hypothetical protein
MHRIARSVVVVIQEIFRLSEPLTVAWIRKHASQDNDV